MAPGSSYTVKLELWPLRKAPMTLTEPATPYMDVEVEAAGGGVPPIDSVQLAALAGSEY